MMKSKNLIPQYKILLCIFLSAWAVPSSAQLNLAWAKTAVSQETFGYSVASDTLGNVYTTGSFDFTCDFDPGLGIYNLTTATGNYNNSDCFIQKLDANGHFKWAKSIGGANTDVGLSIAVDEIGNSYILCRIDSDSVDYDPSATGTFSMNISGGGRFLLKLDSAGNFVWAKHLEAGGVDIALDKFGHILVTGTVNNLPPNSVDFDPGLGIYTIVPGNHYDTFVLKLDTNGNFIWAKTITGNYAVNSFAITVDNDGNVLTTGQFVKEIDFDPGIGTYNLVSDTLFTTAYADIFILKLDSTGNFVWAKSIGNSGNDWAYDIITDNQNKVYTTGLFYGHVDFDPGPGVYMMNCPGTIMNYQVFTLKLEANGNFDWASQIGNPGNGDITSYFIAVDSLKNVYTVGKFWAPMDFDPGPLTFNLNQFNGGDIFIQKLDSTGSFIFANQVGDTNSGWGSLGGDGNGFMDKKMNIYLTGSITGMADFNPTSSVFNVSSSANWSAYMVKLGQCTNTGSTTVIKVCDSYIWNGLTYTLSGTYYDTLSNAAGCDSALSLNLTIPQINNSVILNGSTLTAVFAATNTTYQWVNCNTGLTSIPGASNQSFMPSVNGNYAAIIMYNGCADTSSCFLVSTVGLQEELNALSIKIEPNPSQGVFTISGSAALQDATYLVTDIAGRTILEKKSSKSNKLLIDLSSQTKGIYFLNIKSNCTHQTIKLIKE